MGIGSAVEEKAGLFMRARCCLKALAGKARTKFVNVVTTIRTVGQDDPRRIIHSLKVGLALTLVSILYYSRLLYDSFGIAGMWAILTVVVVFEFTVGGTLSKSLNRGFATLLAGALGLGAEHLASLCGDKGHPIVLGILVFLLATTSTFTRFFPRIKARYDYGILIFIMTFSMVSVSGYRLAELVAMAHQRLSTVVIGGAICIVVSTCICPVWAGEDLHKLIVTNTEKLASYLEGFGGAYFQCPEDGGNAMVSNNDKPFLQGYKSVLNSKSTEESMANLARWEPRHGPFTFRHPWNQYLKIGALLRQCVFQIEALNCYIYSDIQAPQEFLSTIQESCTKMSEESSMALKSLASAIKTMTNPSSVNVHVEKAKIAIKDLKIALEASSAEHIDLLAIVPAATVASILIEIVKCVENLSESVHELANLAHFKTVQPNMSPEKPQLFHRGTIKPVGDNDHIVITVHEASTDSPENKENSKATKPSQHEIV